MRFLDEPGRKKVLRTVLYGDQEFTKFELEIVHTPLFQRLYNLKQLGFADKVYPDAIHSRFNHLLGVCEVVSQMSNHLAAWMERNPELTFTYGDAQETSDLHIKGVDLRRCFEERRPSLRLMALLHDLTHAAFGHTLEDEVRVFREKHDDPARQIRFFDGLLAQLVYIWRFDAGATDVSPDTLRAISRLEFDQASVLRWAEDIWAQASPEQQGHLAGHLAALDYAIRLLLYLEFAHHHDTRVPPEPPLLVGVILEHLGLAGSRLDLVLHRDLFMIDMVGNTMCADLLDYARRDPENAGLKVSFDTRFLRYLTLVTVGGDSDSGDLSPTGRKCIRVAIQFFKEKMRHDVLSEMSMVLKTRYLITERVLFHPTKCAAGALLGTAAQLLGLKETPPWMQVLGDQQFLSQLDSLADALLRLSESTKTPDDRQKAIVGLQSVDPDSFGLLSATVQEITGQPLSELARQSNPIWSEVNKRAKAGSIALWRLASRRLPKLAFRLRPGAHQSGGMDVGDIAKAYTDPIARYDLERRLENAANLPMGSVTIHCPGRRTSMKLAGVLVVGNDPSKVRQLRKVTEIVKEELDPYQDEIQSVERMYASIWQFQIFLDDACFQKQPVLEWAILRELKGLSNDALLADELKRERGREQNAYSMLMDTCVDDVPPALLSTVVARLDQQPRFRGVGTDLDRHVRAVIRAVQDEQNGRPKQQALDLGLRCDDATGEARLDRD
jgi:HD superfamily phosphohydrolase